MIKKQQIKVFLSSTFIDMQEERNYLVKKIFPAIKRECSSRGVDFVALDLRWGINDEMSRSGKVVEICMDEIVRSRPFFIGLLGGRYGWIPQGCDNAITEKLLLKYPWISNSLRRRQSITEMEMRFGVLDNPEHINAFFFEKRPNAISKKFREEVGSLEEEKLNILKKEIKDAAANGKCFKSEYDTVKSLGQQVYNVIMAKVEELYPRKIQTKYQEYSMLQSDYLQQRRDVYVKYSKDEWNNSNLVIYGAKGIGKTAYIANNAAQGLGEDEVLAYTVVNQNIYTAEHCRRMLLNELKEFLPNFDLAQLDTPIDQPIDLQGVFASNGFDRKVRWVIDGVEKLSTPLDRTCAWVNALPEQLEQVALTTSDISLLDNVIVEKFNRVDIYPLYSGEIMEITRSCLKEYSKALSASQLMRIGSAERFTNPYILKIFLQELLQFGEHEKLDDFIENYYSSRTNKVFFYKILKRIDNDFGRERMQRMFKYIYMCANGLPVESLIREFGLNHIEWVAINTAISPFVSEHMGYILMKEGIVKDAVQEHYVIDEKEYDTPIVKVLCSVLKNENRKLLKTVVTRTRKESLLLYLFAMMARQVHYFFMAMLLTDSALEMERIRLNRFSILNLYFKGGRLRKFSRECTLSQYFSDDKTILFMKNTQFLEQWHMSSAIRFKECLAFRMLGSEDIFLVLKPISKFYENEIDRKTEIKRVLMKLNFMPLSSSVKKRIYLMFKEEETKTLHEVLDNFHSGTFEMQDLIHIMGLLPVVFTMVSDDEVNAILSKSLAKRDNCTDESYRCIISFIAAVAAARLNHPSVQEYISESLGDVLNKESIGVDFIYCTIDLFVAVFNHDTLSIKMLSAKADRIIRNYTDSWHILLFYLVKLVELRYSDDYYLLENKFIQYVDELIQKIRNSQEIVISLRNLAFILYNLKEYDFACKVFEIACGYVSSEEPARLAEIYDFMGWSAYNSSQYKKSIYSFERMLELKEEYGDAVPYRFSTIYRWLAIAANKDKQYFSAIAFAKKSIDNMQSTVSVDKGDMCRGLNNLGVFINNYLLNDIPSIDDIYVAKRNELFEELWHEGIDTFKRCAELWDYIEENDRFLYATNWASFINGVVKIRKDLADESIMKECEECMFKLIDDRAKESNEKPLDQDFSMELLRLWRSMGEWEKLNNIVKRDYEDGTYKKEFYEERFLLAYYSGKQPEEALADVVDLIVSEVGNSLEGQTPFSNNYKSASLKDIYSKVEALGIVDGVLNELKERAALQESAICQFCLMKFGEYSGNEEYGNHGFRVEEGEVLLKEVDGECASGDIQRFLELKDDDMALACHQFLTREVLEYLISKGDFFEVFHEISAMPIGREDFGSIAYLILNFLQDKTNLISEMLKEDESGRNKESLQEFLVSYIRGQNTDSVIGALIYSVRKELSLGYDPDYLDISSYLCELISDEALEEVLDIWDSTPEVHDCPIICAQYAYVLTLKERYKEAEQIFEKLYSRDNITQEESDVLPKCRYHFLMFCINSGNYSFALEIIEKYQLDVAECIEGLEWQHWIALYNAYAGNLEDALLAYEKNNAGRRTLYQLLEIYKINSNYIKAILLLKSGIFPGRDIQSVIHNVDRPDMSDETQWLDTLYTIELARYFNRTGDQRGANFSLKRVRYNIDNLVKRRFLGMCKFELAKLEAEFQ